MDDRLVLRNDDTYDTYNRRLISLTPDDVNKLTLDALLFIYNTKYYLRVKTFDINSKNIKISEVSTILNQLKNDNTPPLIPDYVDTLLYYDLCNIVIREIPHSSDLDENFINLLKKLLRIYDMTQTMLPSSDINSDALNRIKALSLIPDINDITINNIDGAISRCKAILKKKAPYTINTYTEDYINWYKNNIIKQNKKQYVQKYGINNAPKLLEEYAKKIAAEYFNSIINNSIFKKQYINKKNLLTALYPSCVQNLNDDQIFDKMTPAKFDEIFTDINPFVEPFEGNYKTKANNNEEFINSHAVVHFINFVKPEYVKDKKISFEFCTEKDFHNLTNYKIFLCFSHPSMLTFFHTILQYILDKYKREGHTEYDDIIALLEYFIFIQSNHINIINHYFNVEKIKSLPLFPYLYYRISL